MTATFIFCQNVNLSCEFCMACYCTWFCKNLTSFDVFSFDTTQQSTDVITSLSFVQEFTEHFDTSYSCFLNFFFDTDDFYFFVQMQNTTLYSTSCNSTTTCDCEYVLYWHQERLICSTLRIWDPAVNSIHQFHDLVAPWAVRIFQSFQSRTLDDWCIIAWELILVQQLTDFHVYQFKQFFVVYHIAFVHEYYDVRYTYLTRQQDVLFCLSHNTIGSSYNQDSTIHLSSTSDHVFNVVSMAWAVNVCVVTFFCFILNVSSRDCDSTFSFFWSFIDIFECYSFTCTQSFMQSFCNSCSQSSFTMVNVSNGTNVTMWFASFKFSFSHY